MVDRLVGVRSIEGISTTAVHTWEDMLYKICTNDVFRGDLPIDNTRDYIDSITTPLPRPGGSHAAISTNGMNTIIPPSIAYCSAMCFAMLSVRNYRTNKVRNERYP